MSRSLGSRARLVALCAAGVSGSAAGCGALLDLGERPIDDGVAAPRDASPGSPPDARSGRTDGGGGGGNGGGEDGEAAPPDTRIPCVGGLENAFFCDDFEAATLSPRWTRAQTGAGAKLDIYRPGDGGIPPLSGMAILASGFDPIPATGEAQLRFPHPSPGGGPIALRFSFYLLEDSWPYVGERVPVAYLRTAGGDGATLVFLPQPGGDGNGNLEVDIPGQSSIQVGPSSKDNWICYQLVFDGARLEVYVGNDLKDYRPYTKSVVTAGVGMGWTYGPNSGANHFFYYDNVIVAPARLPCQ